MKVATEVRCSGAEAGTCPPAQNKQQLGFDSKFFSRESQRKGRCSLALGQHCTVPGEPAWTALLPLPPSKMKVAMEVHCSGAEAGTCPPAQNKQWLGSDSKFFSRESQRKGHCSLALGQHCTVPGEPAWTALLPLPPSKMKVAAEVHCAGAEAETCPPDWDK